MPHTKPQQAEVLAHYQEIAAEYNARANQTCERTYRRLVDRFMRGRPRLLELGGGSSDLLESLESSTAVACDLSREMLLRRPHRDRSHRVVAVGEHLPFSDARFDGVFSINVLEHVIDLERVLTESAQRSGRRGSVASVNAKRELGVAARPSRALVVKDPRGSAPIPDVPSAPPRGQPILRGRGTSDATRAPGRVAWAVVMGRYHQPLQTMGWGLFPLYCGPKAGSRRDHVRPVALKGFHRCSKQIRSHRPRLW